MTSKAQILTGTALKFNGEAGADKAFSMEGVTTGAGRVSEQKDLGASPRDFAFDWTCELLCQATPTQYATVDFYIAVAPDNDATMIPGDVGNADAALGDLDQLRNLQYIGSVVIEEADTSKMVGFGSFECTGRYLTIVGVNNSGATLNATDSNFIFNLIPKVIQGQAA
jgi:hypothetical protein